MVFTNARPFPYLIGSASNITPFTYTDGTTYLSQLEQMREWLNDYLVPAFNEGIENAIAEYQAGLGNAEAYVDEMISYINNKTGTVEVQRTTLNAPYTLTVDPQWPTNHPVDVVLTQNHIGAYPVTLGPNITGPLTVNPAANAVTEFTLIPKGDGTWKVFQLTSLLGDLWAAITTTDGDVAALEDLLDTVNTAVLANTTAIADLENRVDTELPLKQDKSHAATVVHTFAELVAAVANGGTVRIGSTITATAQVNLTVPVRIEGGSFILPNNAGYPVFYITSSDVAINGVTFSGAGTDAEYNIGSRFIFASGSYASYISNIVISGCKMVGCQSEAIRITAARHCTVEKNTIRDFLYGGIMLLSVEDSTVANNHVDNAVMREPVVNVYGIAATDSSNNLETRCRNIKITGNSVSNIPWEAIETHGGEAIVITGNTVTNSSRGIALVTGNDTRLAVPARCVVTGNYVYRGTATEREGISLFGRTGSQANAVITGNTVRGYTAEKAMWIDADTVDQDLTLVADNTHPHVRWTALDHSNTGAGGWTVNAQYPIEYMVDGTTVSLRGLGTSNAAPQGNTLIGVLPWVAWPSRLEFVGTSAASNVAGGRGVIGVYPNGEVWMLYKTTADSYSYTVEGSYQRSFIA